MIGGPKFGLKNANGPEGTVRAGIGGVTWGCIEASGSGTSGNKGCSITDPIKGEPFLLWPERFEMVEVQLMSEVSEDKELLDKFLSMPVLYLRPGLLPSLKLARYFCK